MTVDLAFGGLSIARRNADDIKYIVLHHSATEEGNVKSFREYHMQKLGFGDIGYHFVIGNGRGAGDGEIQEGRPVLMTGAHAPGRNEDSIGICLVGNFTKNKPTNLQIETLNKLLKDLLRQYAIKPERVLGHKEVSATDCPGSLDVVAIRALLTKSPPPKIRIGGTEIEGVMIDDRVYAPVRDLINAFNYRIDWDGETRTVNITMGGE